MKTFAEIMADFSKEQSQGIVSNAFSVTEYDNDNRKKSNGTIELYFSQSGLVYRKARFNHSFSNLNDNAPDFKIYEYNGVSCKVEAFGCFFECMWSKLVEMKNYCDNIKAQKIQRATKMFENAKSMALDFLAGEYGKGMMNSCAQQISWELQLNPVALLCLERYLENKWNFEDEHLFSDFELRSKVAFFERTTTRSGCVTSHKETLKSLSFDFETIYKYYADDFSFLVNHFKGVYSNLSSEEVVLFVHHSLHLASMRKFSEDFYQLFKDDLDLDKVTTLENIIEKYIKSKRVEASEIETELKFIVYLYYCTDLLKSGCYINACYEYVGLKQEIANRIKEADYIEKLTSPQAPISEESPATITDVDMMSGDEFEHFLAALFKKLGYKAETTKQSGDQGIDVIAQKGSQKIGIQAKRYAGNVGNDAVQEAIAGKAFYKLDKVMVITNASFTQSAINLAQSADVILWDREILKDKLQ